MTDSTPAMDAALTGERARLHRDITASSVAAASLLTIVLVVAAPAGVGPTDLPALLASLILVLGARLAIAWFHRRAPQSAQRPGVWLTCYRASFMAHGLVWSMAGAVLLPAADAGDFNLLAFALFALAAASAASSAERRVGAAR